MSEGRSPFDGEHYGLMDQRRSDWLRGVLPALLGAGRVKSALDAAAGLGYFSGLLASEFGLEVTAFDARQENVKAASERHPGVRFLVDDVEEFRLLTGHTWDLVLCFGLLYHLENPFRALRNLRASTRHYLLLESRVAPGGTMAYLVEENPGPDQSLRSMAFVPSEAAFVKMLYAAGFAAVYRASALPDGPEFRGGLLRRRVRTIMLATMNASESLEDWGPGRFVYAAEPHALGRGFRGRFPVRWLARCGRWRVRNEQS